MFHRSDHPDPEFSRAGNSSKSRCARLRRPARSSLLIPTSSVYRSELIEYGAYIYEAGHCCRNSTPRCFDPQHGDVEWGMKRGKRADSSWKLSVELEGGGISSDFLLPKHARQQSFGLSVLASTSL